MGNKGKMRPPPSLHYNFFSSLEQVEKRLKSEQQPQPSAVAPTTQSLPLETNNLSMESLSSPIHIHLNQPSDDQKLINLQESSELPQAFLSCSPQFPPTTHENPLQSNIPNCQKPATEPEANSVDDIEKLIQLLGLSDCGQEGEEEEERSRFGCGSCHCKGGFYSKIAGVKGPKCGKEVERLEGWIKHLLNGDGGERDKKSEPLRLALLLLGKAAFVSQGEDGGFGGLEFPSAIVDFLMNDPSSVTYENLHHSL